MKNTNLKSFLNDLCMELGLNTAHDYDGVETDSDVEIYSKAVVRKIREIKAAKIAEKVISSTIEKFYDGKGNATHYAQNRLNAINKYERVYGTLATMAFCEITAERYRERIGKKDNQSLEQEVLKISWYENAAKFYFEKLDTEDEIVVNNRVKQGLPWED